MSSPAFEEVAQLVAEGSGTKPNRLAPETELEEDLGIRADDFHELMEAFSERFGTDMSRYAEFGSKQALFDLALERYDETVIQRSFGPLEAPGAGIVEVRDLLEFYGSQRARHASGRGCLLCNTAVEFGPEDAGGSGFVKRYFKRLSTAFYNAIDNARRSGERRPPSSRPRSLAYSSC